MPSASWFWKLQFFSWSGILVVTFLSLSFWQNSGERPTYEPFNTIFQCGIGFLLSLLLKPIFDVAWDAPLALRTFVYFLAVAVIAGIWTLLRMETYTQLSGAHSIWAEFGGWYYASLFIFLFWSALYCGVKYFILLENEHKIVLEMASFHEQEQVRRLHAETIAREAQLKMLRYQLNPHFLFNTLNSINALIRLKRQDQARDMIVRLSQFLRHSLSEDPIKKITLEQEVRAVLLYLDIEKTRFADRLRVEVEIGYTAKKALVPSLLLQPLAENAIKYAIAVSESGGIIAIRANIDDQTLAICVSDSGSSGERIDEDPAFSGSTGVGLVNIRERLQTLYPDNFRICQSRDTGGGMTVNIRIPAEYHEQATPEAINEPT
ncbi:histidine kinase [Microbulbifer salipaludis]|uniref:Histidine kinase n=1 Tax=Microbulbifer salipaludis TaxID=187980 RepID=A0ABS3E6S4_9GAMM|nr:histidine kinase [Microbulbifer salipaludis]